MLIVYKYWQRNYLKDNISDLPTSYINIKPKDLTEEEFFAELWGHPEHWSSLHLTIDKHLKLTRIKDGATSLFAKHRNLYASLNRFLGDVPNNILHKLNPELRFLHITHQYVRKLIGQSAIVPQILQNKKGEAIIRWLPALFNEEVTKVYEQLLSMYPSNLVLCS